MLSLVLMFLNNSLGKWPHLKKKKKKSLQGKNAFQFAQDSPGHT